MPTSSESLSWRRLESRLTLEDLPAFHRAFLRWRGVQNVEALPLRRVQQRVEAELNQMVAAGLAERTGQGGQQDWHLKAGALDGFAKAP